jgi:SAM-dependent methyltransferase
MAMPLFLPAFDQLAIHRVMLRDRVRLETFARAIRSVIMPESSVLDLGCGTGILGLIAARAGARRVVFVDRASILDVAREMVGANPTGASIDFLAGDSRLLDLGKRFDVIVSEWLGVHVLQENMIDAVVDARNRFLKEGGRLIPERVTLWMAPLLENPLRAAELDYWAERREGLDLSCITRRSCEELYVAPIAPAQLLGRGAPVLEFDVATFEVRNDLRLHTCTQVPQTAKIEGICGWFIVALGSGVVLDTSPFAPLTHWQHAIYPSRHHSLSRPGAG